MTVTPYRYLDSGQDPLGQVAEGITEASLDKLLEDLHKPYQAAPVRRSPRTRSERIEALTEWLWAEVRPRAVPETLWHRSDYVEPIPKTVPYFLVEVATLLVNQPEQVAAIARGERP